MDEITKETCGNLVQAPVSEEDFNSIDINETNK